MTNAPTAPFVPHVSGHVASEMGVVGTLGTSDTAGTARILPFSVNPTTGAAYVDLIGAGTNLSVIPATGFSGGTVGVGTAAVEMTFTGVTKAIQIQADSNNGTMIYVGGSTVSQAGSDAIVRLDPGDAVSINLNDATAAVYAVGGTTAQKVYKVALT